MELDKIVGDKVQYTCSAQSFFEGFPSNNSSPKGIATPYIFSRPQNTKF